MSTQYLRSMLSKKWLWAATLILLVGGILTADKYLSEVRVTRVGADIKSHGGSFIRGSSVIEKLRSTVRHGIRPTRRDVALRPRDVGLWGRYFDHAWLDRNDYLTGIKIDRFNISDCPLDGADIARIIDGNPIYWVGVQRVCNADQVAAALRRGDLAENLEIDGSDLTDSGLAQLPLERIDNLSIAETRVTSRGLEVLGRCTRLEYLTLDGKQFDANVAELLQSLPSFKGLSLYGEHVTDDQLALIRTMRRIEYFAVEAFERSHVSKSAIRKLRAAKPELDFFVDSIFADPEVVDALPQNAAQE